MCYGITRLLKKGLRFMELFIFQASNPAHKHIFFLTDVHKFGFAIFMIGGVTHMILTCLLSTHNDFKHSKIIRKRKLTVAVHIISFVAALGFFYRHNKYCEPYGKF